MDEQQASTSTPESKSNLNPLLIVVILIIVAAVGVMLWLGNNKSTKQAASVTPTAVTEQQPTAAPTTAPTTAPSGMKGPDVKGTDAMEQAITVEGGNFYFKPSVIKVKKGDKVKITFNNAGGMHDFVLDGYNVKTDVVQGGASQTVEFTADKAGTFEYYCSIGNHRQMGMKGTLTVE